MRYRGTEVMKGMEVRGDKGRIGPRDGQKSSYGILFVIFVLYVFYIFYYGESYLMRMRHLRGIHSY